MESYAKAIHEQLLRDQFTLLIGLGVVYTKEGSTTRHRPHSSPHSHCPDSFSKSQIKHLLSSPPDTRYCGMTADHIIAFTGAVWDRMGRRCLVFLRVILSTWKHLRSTREISLSSFDKKATVEELPGFHATRRMGLVLVFWKTVEY